MDRLSSDHDLVSCRGRHVDHAKVGPALGEFTRHRKVADVVGVLDALGRSPHAIGFWDADLATPLSELPAFVDLLAARPEIELVIGSRVKLMGRSIERRAWRHYSGRLFATAA